jgi:hypothetical protein
MTRLSPDDQRKLMEGLPVFVSGLDALTEQAAAAASVGQGSLRRTAPDGRESQAQPAPLRPPRGT